MGVFFTPDYVNESGDISHSRILYDQLQGTVVGFDGDPDTAPNANKPNTWQFWDTAPLGESGSTWQLEFDSPQMVDAVGIAAHDIEGARVIISVDEGNGFETVIDRGNVDGGALLFLFKLSAADRVRVVVRNVSGRVGVIYVGRALKMLRKAYADVGLVDLSRLTTFQNVISEGGQWLGRTIKRQSVVASYQWEHLPLQWYRDNFDALVKAARVRPFFIAARPAERGTPLAGEHEDVAYAWVEADIRPEKMGVRDFVSVQMNVTGFDNDTIG